MKNEEMTMMTRRKLAEAFKTRIKTIKFSKITVNMLINDCNISRNTFYYHFNDINSLVKWILEQEALEVVKKINFFTENEQTLNFLFDYVEKNDYFIISSYESIGYDAIKNFLLRDLSEMMCCALDKMQEKYWTKLDDDFKIYMANFFTTALINALVEYAYNKDKKNKKKYIDYLLSILNTSFSAIVESKLGNKK